MNIRQRKLKEDDTSSAHINIRSRVGLKQPRQLKKAFIILIILVLCVTYFLGIFTSNQSLWLDGIVKGLGYRSEYRHAVIIDAGSSGSRVLAYKFRVPFTIFSQGLLDLEEEYFEQSKPGLSSYADDPVKGADTIAQLIKKAEFLTPPEKRNTTPLIVRATAGLRLLPAYKAQKLISQVNQTISRLGYDTGPHSVEIMDGSDEGIYIWYTLNLLHGLMQQSTMAALDLGGGSTQITYQLRPQDKPHYPPQDQFTVPNGDDFIVYTHSYLNLGLLAARKGIFTMEAGGNENATELTSVCVEPIIQNEPWTYANKQYIISGAPRPKSLTRVEAYERCHAVVRRYVLATLDYEPKSPPRGSVAAMSYFYDVAVDSGMIDMTKGGTVECEKYRYTALKACSAANVEQPFACIDLVYITTLLNDAYKIDPKDPISLYKKINGHEVSWALGLAYTTVMDKLSKEIK